MNEYLLKYLCIPTLFLFLFGCSATLEQRVDKTDSVDSRLLEKKINDLSCTISLIVHDANRLHNDVEEVKTSNKTIQEKIDGLELTIRNLNEQIGSLSSFVKTSVMVQPPSEKTDVTPQLSITDSSTPSDKSASDIQKTVHAEDQLAVAKGFWDAMNAKDIQAVRLYVTRESRDKLQIKDNNTPTNCKANFGDIKMEDNKTTIETTMQTYKDAAKFEVQMQTILIKEDGQWKVDADQTMMTMFGGAMGEMMKGLGKALEEGFTKGMQEMGKTMAEGMQKGFEEMKQTGEEKPDMTPSKQAAISDVRDQTEAEGRHEGYEEVPQAIVAKPDIPPSRQETTTAMIDQPEKKALEESKPGTEVVQDSVSSPKQESELNPETASPPKQETTFVSEEAKRESFVRENIVRLAEAQVPDFKGMQWNILGFEHKAHLTHVEAEPVPATIGYPRLKFVVSFKNPEQPRVIGTFCFKDGQYSLFSAKKN